MTCHKHANLLHALAEDASLEIEVLHQFSESMEWRRAGILNKNAEYPNKEFVSKY